MSSNISKIVVFGGTGAQGIPVVKALAQDGRYHVRVQTRDPNHSNTKEFEGLPNITYIKGHIESEPDLRSAMEGMDGVYFLANGFAVGEKSELFWSIRAFEIAIQSNIKFFVYSSLDYVSKKGNYDEKYRCGHYDAKGRISEWIKYQPLDRMKWSILTSGPYMEMMNMMWKPYLNSETDTWEFIVPVGDGAIPMIHLDDLGRYARWIFDNPDESAGLDLEIATQHVKFDEVAKAFTNVTGKKAVYKSVPIEAWLDKVVTETASSAYQVPVTDSSAMSWKKNFTGWYNVFRDSGGSNPVVARDYKLLDKILPDRVRTIEEWMRKVNYDGSAKHILKDRIDKNGDDRYKGGLKIN